MLPVIHQDDRLVAISKPSGLLVHRSQLDRHETRFAVQLLRDQLGRHVHPIHRLDRGTSGVLLFGLDAEAARAVSQQFEAGEVAKRYLAVVRGWPAESGSIDHALSRQYDDYEHIPADAGQAPQPALTHYRRLATTALPYTVDRYPESRYALVELNPLTGRRHQLRRHMKHIAHPIIGDATHGKGKHNRLFAELFGGGRLLLACTRLSLRHPVSGEELTLAAAPDEDFTHVCSMLGWGDHLAP